MSLFVSDDRTNSVTETFEHGTCSHRSTPPTDSQSSKKADLAGPGIGDYTDLEQILPGDYHSLLTPKDPQKAIFVQAATKWKSVALRQFECI